MFFFAPVQSAHYVNQRCTVVFIIVLVVREISCWPPVLEVGVRTILLTPNNLRLRQVVTLILLYGKNHREQLCCFRPASRNIFPCPKRTEVQDLDQNLKKKKFSGGTPREPPRREGATPSRILHRHSPCHAFWPLPQYFWRFAATADTLSLRHRPVRYWRV